MVERRMSSDLPDFLQAEGFLTEAAAATALCKTVRTLQNWRQRRVGPAYTILGPEPRVAGKRTGQVIYHRDWLREYLLSNKRLPVARPVEGERAADQDSPQSPPAQRSKRHKQRAQAAADREPTS
jgi:hypothetical protein